MVMNAQNKSKYNLLKYLFISQKDIIKNNKNFQYKNKIISLYYSNNIYKMNTNYTQDSYYEPFNGSIYPTKNYTINEFLEEKKEKEQENDNEQ